MTLEADATAGQEQTAAADTTKTATTAAETTTAATTEGAAKAAEVTTQAAEKAADTAVESTWRDDWREQMVAKLPESEREKELTRLRRYASPENVYKSHRELEKRVSTGMLKPTLADGATEAEVAEYRKANGIPDAATPEAYGITFPQGYEPNDADKADVSGFVAKMHAKNVPPAVVKEVWGEYLAIKEKADQQLYEAAQQQTINYKAELKAEWGRDFDKNSRLGNAHLVQALGEDQAKAWMGLTLADGTKLGDHPITARYIVSQAMATMDDAALVTSEFADGGKSLDEQYKAAINLKFTDPKAYNDPAHQDKLMKLAAARANKKAA